MRIGLIGAGAIAARHLEILAVRGDVEVAAVCDSSEERARKAAAAIGARPYTQWEAMLGDEALDAVFVCTPPASHAAPAVAALGRQLPVYVEKPLARSHADGLEIVSAWEASGAVCAVGYQWRSLDLLADLRAALGGTAPGLLVSRSFGPTEGARGDLAALGAAAEGWFADPARSGGILFELGSHDIDLQLAVAGPVATVQAVAGAGLLGLSGAPRSGLHDAVSLLLRFEGGGLGAVHVAWTDVRTAPLYTLDVLAADVALELVLDPEFRIRGRARGRGLDLTAAVDPRVSSVDRFIAAVRSGDRDAVPCTPDDAFGTLRTALACEQAIATGKTVEVGEDLSP